MYKAHLISFVIRTNTAGITKPTLHTPNYLYNRVRRKPEMNCRQHMDFIPMREVTDTSQQRYDGQWHWALWPLLTWETPRAVRDDWQGFLPWRDNNTAHKLYFPLPFLLTKSHSFVYSVWCFKKARKNQNTWAQFPLSRALTRTLKTEKKKNAKLVLN